MKIITERLPKSLVALEIELEPQQVQKGLERAARKLSQQYRIPGFRPGKAPRQIVENYFGRDRLLEEATEDLIQKTFPEALKQQELAPVGRPTLENVEHEPFRYRVTVPVEPEIALADYAAYRLPYEPEAISDESVQKLLDAQREQHVVLKELDDPRPAQPGDMLTVIVSSDLDEEDEDDDDEDDEEIVSEDENDEEIVGEDEDELEELDALEDAEPDSELDELDDAEPDSELDELDGEAEGTERQLPLVDGRIDPEFYEALVGANAGDTVTVVKTYGDDEEDEKLRGKTVNYTINVRNVQERELPDWDELPTLAEFEGDFDALRDSARNRLEKASSDKARRELVDSFLGQLETETPFDLPEAMIEERAHELFHQQVAEYQRYGISEENYLKAVGKTHEEAIADYAEQAERDVRRSMVLRELVRRESILVSDADIGSEGERFAEDFPPERHEEVRRMLGQPNMLQMLASAVLDRKLNDRIVSLATGAAGEPGEDEATPDLGVDTAAPSPGEMFGDVPAADEPVDDEATPDLGVDTAAPSPGETFGDAPVAEEPGEDEATPESGVGTEPEFPAQGPAVLPGVSDGGLTADVFEDAGTDLLGGGSDSVEQATVGEGEPELVPEPEK